MLKALQNFFDDLFSYIHTKEIIAFIGLAVIAMSQTLSTLFVGNQQDSTPFFILFGLIIVLLAGLFPFLDWLRGQCDYGEIDDK